ncbi:MAG: PLP-dependent aminotransferase family protein [Rhodovibrionaceae bacterium]
MTNWLPDLERFPGPRYAAIAQALAQAISDGELTSGDRLPPQRDLAWKLGVTVGTVTRGYSEAERRGLVKGEVGRGTYIRPTGAVENWMMRGGEEDSSGIIDMNFILPTPNSELESFGATLTALGQQPDILETLGYQPHIGRRSHREAGSAWLARSGLAVPAERIALVSGAHHGIVAALAAIARPGERILTEALTYPGLQAAARLLGLRLEPVAIDEEGLVPEALEAACRNGEARGLYFVPKLQNPTTATMSEQRRRDVAAVARRHSLPFVEDDLFGLLDAETPTPVTSLAPELGHYVTSLSKTVSPGLRIGYVAAPAASMDRLSQAVRSTCWMATPLTGEIASRWIGDGTADRILVSLRAEAERRRQAALEVLAPWLPLCPLGSLHLWLKLPEPWRAGEFAAEALARGVRLTPSDTFAVGRTAELQAVRIGLGSPRGSQALEQGLNSIAQILREGPKQPYSGIM